MALPRANDVCAEVGGDLREAEYVFSGKNNVAVNRDSNNVTCREFVGVDGGNSVIVNRGRMLVKVHADGHIVAADGNVGF